MYGEASAVVASVWHACCGWLFVITEGSKTFAITTVVAPGTRKYLVTEAREEVTYLCAG